MTRTEARDIIVYATQHALAVKRDPHGAGLTDYGLASCAASTALVLADESHPNHSMVKARMEQKAA